MKLLNGMANDQGKMGNIIGLSLMADLLDKEISEVGTTIFRPPYTPVAIGALAGRSVGKHFMPLRETPMHQWNIDQGATMIEAGLYRRPWYFPKKNETLSEAYIREATTVRKSVGICDVTSLGKIAIQGPDSTEFINRIYTNPFAKLPINKTRYGIMLRDDGLVLDDGTCWRISDTEYFMTTSTSQAGIAMDKEVMHLRDMLIPKFSELIYNGLWFSPEMDFIMSAFKKSQEAIDGNVTLSLFKGNVTTIGRESPTSLYDQEFSSMEMEGGFDAVDSKGFINIHAIRLKAHNLVIKKRKPFEWRKGGK